MIEKFLQTSKLAGEALSDLNDEGSHALSPRLNLIIWPLYERKIHRKSMKYII